MLEIQKYEDQKRLIKRGTTKGISELKDPIFSLSVVKDRDSDLYDEFLELTMS